MSHSSINDLQSRDWMHQLEKDASQFQAVTQRVYDLNVKAMSALQRRDLVGLALRIDEMREGLLLLSKLAGISINVTIAES